MSIHVFASDLDGLFGELERRGALDTQEAVRGPWENREFKVADPPGDAIKFTE